MFKKKPREGDSPQSAAPGGKKHFLRRRWPLLVIAGAAVVGVGVWAGQHRASEVAGGIDYIEVTPARRSITNTYSESGTLSAAESYQVKSLVRGDVLTADFEEGDRVEEGDVLFTIDSSDAANSVERARLTLSQAERDYADAADAGTIRTDIGGTVVSISVAPGDVVTAGQEVAVIRDDTSMLLTVDFPAADAAGFAAGQTAEVTLDGTYEKLTGAVRSVSGTDTLSEGNMLVRSVTIAVPNAGGLTSAQAATASVNGVSALGSAKLRSQNTQTLTADASGTVAALCVSEGSRVGAGSAILQLTSDSLTRQAEQAADSLRSAELSMADAENSLDDYTITAPISGTVIDYLEMEIAVDELDILSIQEGQQATIVADALEDETFTGVVTGVSSNGTTTGGTTTYPVTIRIDDYGQLMPGMNATVTIVVESAEDALAIPNGAVVRGGYVLVTDDSPSAARLCQGGDRRQRRRLHRGDRRSDRGRHRRLRRRGRGAVHGEWQRHDGRYAGRDARRRRNARRRRHGRRTGRWLLMSALIEFDDVCKYYQMGDTTVKAADHITMQIHKGEFVAIVGQSGSGKSTCMNIIGCLDVPTAGSYKLNGRDVGHMDKDELAEIRNELLGFIFQQYNLLPKLDVLENVEVPLVYAGLPAGERHERAAAALERVGLSKKLHNKPSQLSGGQQQRVSIARALAGDPAVILADEPTGALDSHTSREVLAMLQKLHKEGNTVVLITHDNSIAVQAERIIRLEDGHIVYDGDAHAPEAVVQPRLDWAQPKGEGAS